MSRRVARPWAPEARARRYALALAAGGAGSPAVVAGRGRPLPGLAAGPRHASADAVTRSAVRGGVRAVAMVGWGGVCLAGLVYLPTAGDALVRAWGGA